MPSLQHDNDPAIAALDADLAEVEDVSGEQLFMVLRLPEPLKNHQSTVLLLLGELAQRTGFRDYPRRRVAATEAESIVMKILEFDLNGHHRIREQDQANALKEQFFQLADAEWTEYYTNGNLCDSWLETSWSCTPLTSAACDTGIFFVSSIRAGLLWCTSEN